MSGPKPSYYIPPNFDNPHPGPMKLGQLIAQVDSPRYPLDPNGPKSLIKHNLEVYYNSVKIAEHGFGAQFDKVKEGGLFVKALSHVALRLGMKAEKHRFDSMLADIEKLDVEFIVPHDDYVLESMKAPVVQQWLQTRNFRKRVFMITALKIARPSGKEDNKIEIDSKQSMNVSGEVKASGGGAGAPVEGSIKGGKSALQYHGLSFIPTEPFIYVYELRSCRYGAISRTMKHKAHTKGSLLHIESEAQERVVGEKEGSPPDDLEFRFHHVADESLDLEELGLEAEGFEAVPLVDEVGGGKCICVTTKV